MHVGRLFALVFCASFVTAPAHASAVSLYCRDTSSASWEGPRGDFTVDVDYATSRLTYRWGPNNSPMVGYRVSISQYQIEFSQAPAGNNNWVTISRTDGSAEYSYYDLDTHTSHHAKRWLCQPATSVKPKF